MRPSHWSIFNWTILQRNSVNIPFKLHRYIDVRYTLQLMQQVIKAFNCDPSQRFTVTHLNDNNNLK